MKTKTFSLMIIVALFFVTKFANSQIYSVETCVQSVGISSAMINVTAYGQTTFFCSIVYGQYGLNEYETGTYFLEPNVQWTIPLIDLIPGTTYMYMVKVSWEDYTITSNIVNFSTQECPTYATFENVSINQCSAMLKVTYPIEPEYNYQWFLNGNPIENATSQEYWATVTGDYFFSASSQYCGVISNDTHFEIPGLDLTLVAPSDLCENQTATVFALGNADNYIWEPAELFGDPGVPETTIHLTKSTVIKLTGYSLMCQAVREFFIAVHEQPQLGISFLDSVCIKSNEPVQLIGLPTGGTFLGQGVFNHGNDYSTFNANEVIAPGIYTIQYVYQNQYGCGGSISKPIVVTEEPVVSEMVSKNNNLYVYGIFPNQILISVNGQNYYSFQQNETEAIFPNVPVSNGDYITIMAKGTNGCFITKEFSYGLGYEETEKDKIKCYPNPFRETLNVENPDGYCEIQVIDLQGKIVQNKSVTGNFVITRDNLPVGIYFLRIISEKEILTKKIQIE